MPYIKLWEREDLEYHAVTLGSYLKNEDGKAGKLNYFLTKLLMECYPNPNYHDYNEIIGMLECCKLEFYRMRVGPYEDIKREENGDV